MLTHYSLKAGLEKFKTEGENSLNKELAQLNKMDVFVHMPESNLSDKQNCKVLSTVTFIEQKRNCRIKGRVCADSHKQHKDFCKEEVASPTVTNKSVFLTGVIDFKEHRNMVTVGIMCAYLCAVYDQDVHMVLE